MMEEHSKKQNRQIILAVLGLCLGLTAIPLLCVNYIGILVALAGLVCAIESSSKKDKEGYSSLSAAAFIVNLIVAVGGFTMLMITWVGLKQGLSETTSLIRIFIGM